ncbi:hypothetical protein niasHT_031876 [Heterodera trifolii]|uniref:G-protein coupled receptors family 1 profile domain-containing protein n=1 Tax=Heterodera trifolii TaxID=157864 RepID=A0ABD2HUI5_9BILA
MGQQMPASTNPMEAVTAAYYGLVQFCDDPSHRSLTLTLTAIALFVIYAVGILSQLVVLPANWRLSEQRSAFLLLLHINVFDLIWLFEYVWLSLEYLIGARLIVKFSLDAFLFRFVNFCIDTFYIELAFNRCIAFLFPRLYNTICCEKNMKICVALTYILSIAYSIYTNWFQERRPFHCLAQLGYLEPMGSIAKNITSLLPDSVPYDAVDITELVTICIPFFLYAVTVLKMVIEFSNQTTSSPMQVAIVLPVGSQGNKEERAKFVNLMQERTRLFSMCLLSQVPYYLSHAIYQSLRFFKINQDTLQIMGILWQLLGTIFHVQQPILMLLLSRDLRESVRNDLAHFFRVLKERLF